MSKKIIVESKNGADNIRKTRQATNESNWEEDSKVWKLIQNIDLNDPNLSKSVNKKGEIKFKYEKPNGFTKKGVAKFKTDSEVSDVITTLAKKIANNNALEYDITYEDEVEFWMILDMLNGWLVSAPKKCQKFFCRNASRQSVDEDAQIQTVEKYTRQEVIKPANGEFTVANGDMLNKKKIKDKKFARSVDSIIPAINAYGFLKYSGPVGSVTSVHQVGESKSFIEECKKYCDKHKDNKKFFVQVDGGAGEDHIPEMRKAVEKYSDRIFVGNTEQVIDWVLSLTK
jgi:hypothetical protein